MYLKSIEIYGFKSFAHKMIFKFDEGITAIVGPNGSGKSNIADAVRWVLGEQSAKLLRGSKMQDVIFAGTETRKPLGYSQVDITIDNNDMKMLIDYSEVTISRRVYRSGESEYLINGVECRLKDINELFMDTGVGKEGYSIIGQGQIDKILSSKPEDRRELFDEATGIVKYKKRKMIAEKNLEEEKQNLIRIQDIIRELEKQQDTLKDQAITAKRYLDYKEELKKYEVNIFINESEKLEQSIKDLQEKEDALNSQIEDLKFNNEKVKEQASKLNISIQRLDNKIDTNKDTSTNLIIEKEKKESGINLYKEQISNHIINLNRLTDENTDLKNKIDQKKCEASQYIENLEKLNSICKEQEAALTRKQDTYEVLNASILKDENEILQIQTNRIERLNEISSIKSKIQRYNTMLENVYARKETLAVRKHGLFSGKSELEDKLKRNQSEKESNLIEKQQLTEKKSILLENITQNEIKIAKLNELLKEKNEALQLTKSKYKALAEISEQYEGYNFSIKKLMELKKKGREDYKGILGVVADLVQVNKLYETAIEIALGGNLQNIVTDNENTAKELIGYLKSNKFGRATFLPLTSIKNRDMNKPITKKEPGFIGYASELVSFEKQYSNIFEFLLGRVVIVENIDYGITLAKKYKYSFKIVTLAGELINPGGALTGGAYKNQKNQFLSRKRLLEAYTKQINVYNSELESLKDKYNNLNERILKEKKEIEILINKEYEFNLYTNQLNLEQSQIEKEVEHISEELSDIHLELEQLEMQEVEINNSSQDLEILLEGSQVDNVNDEDIVNQLHKKIQENKEERNRLSEELTEIKVEVSSIKQQFENARNNSNRLDKEIIEMNQQIIYNTSEKESISNLIKDKEEKILTIKEDINTFDIKIIEYQQELDKLHSQSQKLTIKQEELSKIREEQQENINLLEKDILRLENSKDKLEIQRNAQIDYMWNEYELTLSNAFNYKDESLGSVSTLKKSITNLRDKIKNLGDVNVNAIEDYKTVSERYTFLVEQRDDLIKAEEAIKKVIEELQERMIKQFNIKFKEISKKFNEVFRELFGGGRAMLEISENEDILDAGIELIAQPPGKKLQSMNLLSGGEKAFTAISLLFAIQSLKPSPFCVLDEIEAALDDSNVIRFAKYLKKLSANTQFIIITHRRGTMEVADSLYGITMQEKGISTQVSVKLLEDQLDN